MEPIMSKPKYVSRKINDLKDMLEQTVALHSDRDAFVKKTKDAHVGVSYKKYKDDVFGLGTELLKRNIAGERVILLSENRYEWCVCFMASACCEAVIVPLTDEFTTDEIVSKINMVKGKFIIFSEKYREEVKNIRRKCPTLENFIDMDTITDDVENMSLLRLVDLGSKAIQNGENSFSKLEINSNSVAGIFFGDTLIKDKGVMISHKNFASVIMGVVSTLPVNTDDKSVASLHFSDLSQCVCNFLAISNQGGTISFSDSDKSILENLKENNPTIIFPDRKLLSGIYSEAWKSVGSMPYVRKTKILMVISNILLMLNLDLRHKLFKDILKNLGKDLNMIVLIDKKMKSKALKEFFCWGVETAYCYDLLEASSVVMLNNKWEFFKKKFMGKPLPGISAIITKSSNKFVGEITLSGDNIMVGYYNDKKATQKVIRDDILYTGLKGVRDKNGIFYCEIIKYQ